MGFPPVSQDPKRLIRKRLLTSSGDRLAREIERHAQTRAELERVRAEAARKSQECEDLNARFERAFRGANIHAFAQDRDLRYTWVAGPREGSASSILGRLDDELWSSPEQQSVVALKRRVLETGTPEDCEVSYITPDRRALFALHIDPLISADGTVDGVMCTAVDISRLRSLESTQRRLAADLAAAAQRYELALRGSNVAVFTQDADLRYISVSKSMFGLDVSNLHGRTDSELLTARGRCGHCSAQERSSANAESRVTRNCVSTAAPSRAGTISMLSPSAMFQVIWSA